MSDFTKLQKDKILNYLYKNFKKIDFDNIDQDIFLKKILNEKELKIIDFNNIKNLRPENLDFSFYYKLVDLIKSRS